MSISRKRSISLPLVLTSGLSSVVLALGATPTFSAFTAMISNGMNTVGAGTLVMQESNSAGTATCLSTDSGGLAVNVATCSSINKYGVDAGAPGSGGTTTTVTITNLGSIAAATFALSPGLCTQSPGGPNAGNAVDMCSKVLITIASGTTTVFTGTAKALGDGGPINILAMLGVSSMPPGGHTNFSISASLAATAGNSYQGLKVSQPLTWTFES